MHGAIRASLVTVLIIFVCFIAGLLLIIATNLLPEDKIKNNTLLTISRKNHCPSHRVFFTAKGDCFTECLSLTVGMRSKSVQDRANASLKQAFLDAVTSPTLGGCKSITSKKNYGYDYFRYWHGAQIISKPVLLFTTVPVLRAFVLLMFACTLSFFVVALGSQVSWITASAILIVLFASPLYSQLFVIPYASSWVIGFVAATIILRGNGVSLDRQLLIFLLAGIAVAYLDLLNNPIVVPTVALFAVTLVRWREQKDASICEMMFLLISWFVGYGSFWFLKWLLAASVLGITVVSQDIFGAISFRLSGHWQGEDMSALNSIRTNFLLIGSVVKVSGAVLTFFLAIVLWRRGWREFLHRATTRWRLALQMLAVGSLPVLWIAVLRNHSLIHAPFVAPILSWTLICSFVSVQILLCERHWKGLLSSSGRLELRIIRH